MAGLLPLSGGSIWLDQQRIDTLPPEKRGFGMVFQNYALFPHLSVSRNVGFGLKMRGVPAAEIDKRVAAALDTVQLQGHEFQDVNVDVDRVTASEVDSFPTWAARALLSPDGGWSECWSGSGDGRKLRQLVCAIVKFVRAVAFDLSDLQGHAQLAL